MIQKISAPGSGFRGLLNYTLGPSKSPELVAGNMAGETPRSLSREFGDARAGNEAVGKPVFHASLSADPGDQVTPEQWRAIAEAYIERMGYGESLWVAVRHRDTEHDHVHILGSRVAHDGTRVKDHQEKKRGETIVRDLEREHGLHQVAPSREAPRRAITRDELAAFERTGEVSVKSRLQEHLNIAARDQPTMGEFAERLEAQGVRVRVHVASTGRVSGISYELDGVAVKGSDIGRAYSWQGLQNRQGITYEASRDLPDLQALSRGEDRLPAPERIKPPAAPMPALEKPVVAFHQAAVVVSRVEVIERRQQLLAEQSKAGTVLGEVFRLTRDRESTLERFNSHRNQYVAAHLQSVYTNPQAAFLRLQELIDRDGFSRAAEVLQHSPEEFGRLHGIGVGPLRNAGREQALSWAQTVGSNLHSVGETYAQWTALGPALAQVEAQVPAAQRRVSRISHLFGQLPDLRQLEQELYGAARALGMSAVQGLSVTIVRRVASIASTMALLARSHDRGRDRDDGLGR